LIVQWEKKVFQGKLLSGFTFDEHQLNFGCFANI